MGSAFLLAWNDYLVAIVFLKSDPVFTLPLGLQSFFQQNATDWGSVMAASVLMMLPPIVIFAVLNRGPALFRPSPSRDGRSGAKERCQSGRNSASGDHRNRNDRWSSRTSDSSLLRSDHRHSRAQSGSICGQCR